MWNLARASLFLCILSIVEIFCDDHKELMKAVKELMKDMPDAPDISAFESSKMNSESINWTEVSTLLAAQANDPSLEGMEKPPNKKSGCTNLLWSEDQKFCWARCDDASTSSFWKTWCFTTKVEGNRANKVSCTTDEDCKHDWSCKSSCGMFSPHWDRDNRRPDGYVEY